VPAHFADASKRVCLRYPHREQVCLEGGGGGRAGAVRGSCACKRKHPVHFTAVRLVSMCLSYSGVLEPWAHACVLMCWCLQGADRALASCLGCYCLGLKQARASRDGTTDGNVRGTPESAWLAQTQAECEFYLE